MLDDDRWIPHDIGKFLINVDIITNNLTGCCGMRIIIRDFVGEVYCARAIY